MSSERAGVHTGSAFDRHKARVVVQYARNLPLADMDAIVDRLEACVVPDPRLTRIEAWARQHLREWPDDSEYEAGRASGVEVSAEEVLDIIQGKQ